jgi:hypothetical protein
MCDVFEKEFPAEARSRLWQTILQTPWLDWLILTKRPENILANLPSIWKDGWPNVWLGCSVENQEYMDKRVPHLLKVPAVVHFISAEPLLEPVTVPYPKLTEANIDWLIVGGESGSKARPFHMEWAQSIVDQCAKRDISCFVKQMGENPFQNNEPIKFNHKKGEDPTEWPEGIQVQTWPATGAVGEASLNALGRLMTGVPALDAAFQKGIPEGKIHELHGEEPHGEVGPQ